MKKKIVSVKCEPTSDTSTILEEYIENYMGLNSPNPKSIGFSDVAISTYFNFIEYKISLRVEDEESLLNEKIKEVIQSYINAISIKIEHLQDLEHFEKHVISSIVSYFGWLSDSESDENTQRALTEFKNSIRGKIITLSEKANNEVFSTLLEKRINESRSKFNSIVLKIADTIKSLKNRRTDLMDELANEKLGHYSTYVQVNESDITNVDTAMSERKNSLQSIQQFYLNNLLKLVI